MGVPFEGLPPTESAREGTAGHWVAYHMAMAARSTGFYEPIKVGDKAPNGVVVDQDMIDGAEMYVEALEGFAGTAETMVKIPAIHPEHCWGTPDFWQYHEPSRTLRVTDYKYGHRYVEVFENEQLAAYASGLMDQLGLDDQTTKVEFLIVQPRCFHPDGPVRSWTTSGARLRPIINNMHNAAYDALSDKPLTKTGNHCLDCPAAGVCGTLHKGATAVLEFAGGIESLECSATEIGVRLLQVQQGAALLKAVASGLEEQIMHMIEKGKIVANYSIGFTKPLQKWNVPTATLDGLGTLYGVPLVELQPAMTPKQAIKRKIPEAVIAKVSHTPSGAKKLVLDSTTRSRKIFSK